MTAPAPIVYVVDDDPAVLKALQRLIRTAGFTVRVFESALGFLESRISDGPACLVLDLQMPVLGGLGLQRELADRGLRFPIIFLTGHGNIPKSVQAMKAGAQDFLTKPVQSQLLLKAIRSALEEDAARLKEEAELDSIRARLKTLSAREFEVLRWVISGSLNKQTAYELGITEQTVKFHRAQTMRKMKVESVAELILLVERVGIQPMPKPKP